jgi:tetratricopeptide (TPR) repeat protein
VATITLAALAALGATGSADRETADLFTKRGDKAASQKSFADAVEQYKKAIAEEATYVPALFGLAEAYAAQSLSSDASQQFRAVIAASASVKPFPPAWNDLVTRAKKRLAELDAAAGTTIEKVQKQYVEDLLALAEKWKAKDRAVAERALRRALEIVPDNALAAERLAALLGSAGKAIAVFDGKAWDGVAPTNDPLMSVTDGVLRAGIANKANAVHTTKFFEGDIDLRVEARIASHLGEFPKFTLMACETPKQESLLFGIHREDVLLEYDKSENGGTHDRLWSALMRNMKPAFDPEQWATYEMRIHGEDIVVLLNGTKLAKAHRPKECAGGRVGFLVQDCMVEIRQFTVTPAQPAKPGGK